MTTTHELIGLKEEALHNLNQEYDRLLNLLNQVLCGQINPDRVTIDLANRSWKIEPELPATNGRATTLPLPTPNKPRKNQREIQGTPEVIEGLVDELAGTIDDNINDDTDALPDASDGSIDT